MNEIGRKPRAGQEIKLVDISADAGKGMGIFENLHGISTPGEFAEMLRTASQEYYGTVIREYLDQITHYDPDPLSKAIRQIRDQFIKSHVPEGASGQVRSVCGRFGIVAAAGELATNLGLTGWTEGEAERSAVVCFRAWLDQRGTAGDHDIEAGIRQVVTFIQQHGSSRFEDITHDDYHIAHNRVGFRKYHKDTDVTEYFVLPNLWKDELCRGYDATIIAKEMVARGMLIGEKGRTTVKPRLGKHGTLRVYKIAAGIAGIDAADDPHLDSGDDVCSVSGANSAVIYLDKVRQMAEKIRADGKSDVDWELWASAHLGCAEVSR